MAEDETKQSGGVDPPLILHRDLGEVGARPAQCSSANGRRLFYTIHPNARALWLAAFQARA